MKSAVLLTPSFLFPSIFNSRSIGQSLIVPSNIHKLPMSFRHLSMASSALQTSQTAAPVNVPVGSGVLHQFRAHQAAVPRLSPLEEVRTILDNNVRGTFSTDSQEHEGYPYGSVVNFSCDLDGSPVLAVSNVAVHSKNLLGNPKCSLLVAKDPEDETDIVVTLYGDAISVSEDNKDAARSVYLKRHPNASWVDSGDIHFVQIKPKFVHYMSRVATALPRSEEYNAEEFRAAKVDPISQFSIPISSHMNRDHAEAIGALVQQSTSIKVDFAYMLDLDSLGFNVKAEHQGCTYKLRIPFPRRAQDRKDVKTIIVEMSEALKATV